MIGKSIKAYKKNKFEKTRDYQKINFTCPEYSTGFRWVLRARCVYKNSMFVLPKPPIELKTTVQERCSFCYRENSNPQLEHWVSKNCNLFREFQNEIFFNEYLKKLHKNKNFFLFCN